MAVVFLYTNANVVNVESSQLYKKLSFGGSVKDRNKRIREVIETLQQLQQNMLVRVHVKMMVTCPNVLLEFNSCHINQVVKRFHDLFTTEDVFDSVEI